MKKAALNSYSPNHFNQSKDSKYLPQFEMTKSYFEQNTASRFMCAVDTGIPIQNVCRYTGKLLEQFEIQVVRKDFCRISGEMVEYLSCDRKQWPKDLQMQFPFWKEVESCTL